MADSDAKDVQARLDDLTRRVSALEQRVGLGEPQTPLEPRPEPRPARARTDDDVEVPDRAGLISAVTLVGRTLMVLGGAFLLRYLTEARIVPRSLGTGMGVAYAIVWLVVADLTRRRGGAASSTFFGISSTLVAYPLFWETTLKLHTLTPAWSACAITLYAALGLGVSVLGRLHGTAVATVGPAALTLSALGFATGRPMPFLICLGLLALACVVLAHVLRWHALSACVASVAGVTVLLLTVVHSIRADSARLGGVTPAGVASAQFGLLAIYLAGITADVLRGRRTPGPFTLLNLGWVFVLALGGVFLTQRASGMAPRPWGVLSLLAGAVAFALAYGPLRGGDASRALVGVLSASALGAVLIGVLLALPAVAITPVLCVAAIGTVGLASRRPARGLITHGAAYLLGAALTSGLAARIWAAFSSGFVSLSTWRGAAIYVTMAAAAASCAFTVPIRSVPGAPRRTPVVPLAVLALTLGGAAISWMVGAAKAGATDEIRSSIVRTVVLSGAALVVALIVRVPRLRSARRLLLPLLVAGGLKLVVQDLPGGRPAVLFGTLAIYGATLVLAPRLQRASLLRSAPPTSG